MSADAQRQHGSRLLELKSATKHCLPRLDLAARIARLAGVRVRERAVTLVDRVDLAIDSGEVVGLIGESGSGKSTLGRLAVGLLPLSAGARYWRGELCAAHRRRAEEPQLKLQMVFRNGYAALNPQQRVLDIVGEAPLVHGLIGRRQQVEYVGLQLNRVGLDPTLMQRFPHQFSDGQLARIGLARALAVKPEFLLCDDPLALLDVSVQAQLLNLLLDLRAALGLTYLFVSDDPRAARHISDRIVVMYLGRVVEAGPVTEIFAAPNHPYTQALLAAHGGFEAKGSPVASPKGETPSPRDRPAGCPYHPRCPHAMPRCTSVQPALKRIGPQHWSACFLNDPGS